MQFCDLLELAIASHNIQLWCSYACRLSDSVTISQLQAAHAAVIIKDLQIERFQSNP